MALRFDNRVVIVTGAGGGLGRTYALEFAKRGASVIVNDLGGETHGSGSSQSMADNVVREIQNFGGKAIANYDSVEFGEKIVQSAIDNYGKIDVIVNNAGILRDKAFVNMTNTDWDLIQRVHLKGAFAVTRAAWPHLRKNNYGRIVNTSSNSGIYGSFGQANYAAAKMGLVGLSNTLALEGAKYGIQANALVPTAGSRLTLTVMPQDMVDAMKPDYVTPLVIWLCHETCPESGGVFEAGAGWFGALQYFRSKGAVLGMTTPEDVRDHWSEITNMLGAIHFENGTEASAQLMKVMSKEGANENLAGKSGYLPEKSIKMDPELAKRHTVQPTIFNYTAKDVILYALGVGASTDNLKFVYENAEDFCVLPTFLVCPALMANCINDWPGVVFDLSRLVHGEHYIEILKNENNNNNGVLLPCEGRLKNVTRVVEILDKGDKGAVILSNVETYDAKTNHLLARQQFSVFEVGLGNFGGAKNSAREIKVIEVPKRPPDSIVEQATSVDQAALYRLASGDINPLHIDLNFARLSGFEKPILHGLCTLAFSVRHVLEKFTAGNDVAMFRAVKTRFSKPVIPGQTLRTEMWREGCRVHFQTKVKETDQIVLSSSYVDLIDSKQELQIVEKTTNPGTLSSESTTVENDGPLKSEAVFEAMTRQILDEPKLVEDLNAIVLYVVQRDGCQDVNFTVDLKNPPGTVYKGLPRNAETPHATLTVQDEDLVKLANEELNPQMAFMSGKIKIKGNIMMLQKLQKLMTPKQPKAKL